MSDQELALKAKSCIKRTGYFIVKDGAEENTEVTRTSGKGTAFAEFFDAGYYTRTPSGLDFVYQNTVGDAHIRAIIQSILKRPRWGYSRYFSSLLSSDYAWFFYNRDPENPDEAIHTLLVQLWKPGSKVTYYEGSQLHCFDAQQDPGNWGVLKTPRRRMAKDGVVARVEDMPNGGYTIIDSRLGWSCEEGGFMNIGLGEDEEVARWGEMEVPDTEEVRAKVAELESNGLQTHLTYIPHDAQ